MEEVKKKTTKLTKLSDFDLPPEFSDDKVNSLLEAEDPEFMNKMRPISKDKSLSVSNILDVDNDQLLNEEIEKWKNSKGFRKILFMLLPFLPKLFFKFGKLKVIIKSLSLGNLFFLKNLLFSVGIFVYKTITFLTQKIFQYYFKKYSDYQRQFYKLSLKLKLFFISLFMLIFVSIGVIYLTMSKKIFRDDDELFLSNLEKVATKIYEYEAAEEYERLYDNLRASQNMIYFSKMVANILPSTQSGTSPMVAFDLFFEGFAPDVILELKDREVELRDLVVRVAEGFSFDQLDSADGKREMLEKIEKNISHNLTTGSIKKVRFKTIVLKP